MTYLTTHKVRGHYAYRAWDGLWYVIRPDGTANPIGFETRQGVVAFMHTLNRTTRKA